MDSDFSLNSLQALEEPMDFLSRAWCNSAIQVYQPGGQDGSVVHQDRTLKALESDPKVSYPKMDDGGENKSVPPWKSNDLKSWIWLQQAMHPELNYDRCFRKKWAPWKQLIPFKNLSLKRWLKEIKQRRKEEERVHRAEVHAAISVAGVAAALAAIAAAENHQNINTTNKEAAVATAAALVAAQCAQVAEAMGAKREQLSTVMGSAMSSASATDILTLTAAAATSLKGAATLKGRPGHRDKINGAAPLLPIHEENNDFDFNFDFDKGRSLLAKGAVLGVESPDGKTMLRSVSIILNNQAKVILKIRKINLLPALARTKESVVLDLHAELYKDSDGEDMDTSYLIVLTTSRGTIKLDMMDDYGRYRMWAMTINHMLMLSTSFTRYELQFYKN